MPRLTGVQLSDGSRLWVGTSDARALEDGGSEILAGGTERLGERLAIRFDGATTVIQRVIGELRGSLSELELREAEVEFAVSLSAEAGWFLGKAGGEASLTVRAKLQ
ncbi:MAG: hypothetical protein KDB86_01970 [Actinobacteria bacterium]|nr:hypothetical protein [Actinomycetota bacterium]MCB9390451.1 hypothetical protein [Acidimicrobiia bacterium]